ncbi:MAG: hypothetical protein JO041_05330 [Acidobacteria bacterium]|nr:hypothetical protein [Acidobacteriota bacterium]
MASLHPTLGDMFVSAALLIGMTFLWVRLIPGVTRFWSRIFIFWGRQLELGAPVVLAPQHWGKHISFELPFFSVPAGAITPFTWSTTAIVTAAALAMTYFLGDDFTPVVYIVRALVIIHTTALVYFAFFAARFPHDLPSYTVGMLVFGLILISMVPVVLAFTYYVFDFPWWKKLALTAGTMAYLILFVPMQYALHVCILHYSILFMPLLYFSAGPFLDVLVFVCIYSWGMSWRTRAPA